MCVQMSEEQQQSTALQLATQLMKRESPTPEDGDCQLYIARKLAPLGFVQKSVNVGVVTNSIYTREGEKAGVLAFAGHTDV
ncbi:MAG: succinyl-diaminopimelate desuccinylase, partial [Ghiorsea sp.]|nr:succinyl-diaminopimelate desuccinylase [Ghiorsea sp.]